MKKTEIPKYVQKVMLRLEASGFEAFAVGGCVRDSMRGMPPLDWDLCTSATPSEVKEVFSDVLPVIPTGEKHGTVTVLSDKKPIEVTTFRTDGDYSDNRRPDSVSYIGSVEEDLSRRDFTVNAMAYNPKVGLIDLFGGKDDLKRGIIRCVGNPKQRFSEDALRIMRALRFAAVCGFEIEAETANALRACAPLLDSIAAERIFSELKKLLSAETPSKILLEYRDVLSVIIPRELGAKCFTPDGCRMVDTLPRELDLRLASVIYPSGADAARILSALKSDRKTRTSVCSIIKNAGELICSAPKQRTDVKQLMRKIGADAAEKALIFAAALANTLGKDSAELAAAAAAAGEIIELGECISVAQLEIRGGDLISLGITSGRGIGEALEALLGLVIEGRVKNEKDALIAAAKELI